MAKKKTKKQKAAGRVKSKELRARTKNLVASTILTADTMDVTIPNATFINTRAPFFAANLKKVCRSSLKGSACYRKTANGKRGAKLKAKDFGIDKLDSETLEADCAEAGGLFVPGKRKPIRPGKVEIDFFSPAQAAKFKTLSGPNLRLCRRDDERGYLVPVTNPEHAQKLAKAFDECVDGKKGSMPACALQAAQKATGQKNPPLGEFSSGGTFSHLFTRGR